jgi:hypothetical protein
LKPTKFWGNSTARNKASYRDSLIAEECLLGVDPTLAAQAGIENK